MFEVYIDKNIKHTNLGGQFWVFRGSRILNRENVWGVKYSNLHEGKSLELRFGIAKMFEASSARI